MGRIDGGAIQLQMLGLGTVMPHLKSDKVRVLAVAQAKRSPLAPELPTFAESGLPGFEFGSWYGLVFLGKTPWSIVLKANAEVLKVLNSPSANERFSKLGIEPVSTTPEGFADLVKSEKPKWQEVVKSAKILLR